MNSADTATPIGRTRIKICGVMDPDTALAAADAGADAIGFVFVPGSSRRVSPGRASEIMYALPPFITAVGVVADLSLDDFIELEQSCPTPAFQLHGDEPEDVVAQCGPGVLKAIRFSPDTIIADLTRWSAIPEVDAILIDAPTPGAGEPIDWAALRGAMDTLAEASERESTAIVTKPIMLAGGLSPDNVAEAIRIVRPYAVDVSSGVESARGVKDAARIADFCAAVRSVPGG